MTESKNQHHRPDLTAMSKKTVVSTAQNILTPPPKPSLFKKFIGSFSDPLIRILLVALLLSVGISVYEYAGGIKGLSVFLEPLGIFIAVMLATLIGFWLEVGAEKKIRHPQPCQRRPARQSHP